MILLVFALTLTWFVPKIYGELNDRAVDDCIERLDPIAEVVHGLFVEPDDAYEPVVDEIDRARCEINVSIYLISDQVVLDALKAAEDRGVRIRVQLEENPFGGNYSTTSDATEWLSDNEIEWRWTPDRFRFSHAKYMVIDRQVAIIMNQNLTTSAFNDNREFGVVTNDPQTVAEAQLIFDSDWNDTELTQPLTRVVTSPETSWSVMTGLITSATETVDFYAEIVNDDGFVATLIDAEQRGVDVRLIVNETSDQDAIDVYIQLAVAGVEIRFSNRLYIHSKTMIFDNRTTFIGSQNPTTNSFENNREVGLVIDDPIVLGRARAIFAKDWAFSSTASPERASPHDISY